MNHALLWLNIIGMGCGAALAPLLHLEWWSGMAVGGIAGGAAAWLCSGSPPLDRKFWLKLLPHVGVLTVAYIGAAIFLVLCLLPVELLAIIGLPWMTVVETAWYAAQIALALWFVYVLIEVTEASCRGPIWRKEQWSYHGGEGDWYDLLSLPAGLIELYFFFVLSVVMLFVYCPIYHLTTAIVGLWRKSSTHSCC